MSAEPERRPAFYSAGPGGWRDWWSLLHPPYTAWHLSYVVIGATLVPKVNGVRLLATVLAFFAAVGIAAHALDEWRGRPLRTRIPDGALVAAAAVGLTVAIGLGIAGVGRVGWILVPFIVAGPLLVLGYNLELAGGRIHTDVGFALCWGAFPVITGAVAQHGRITVAPLIAAFAATALSYAQRVLSTPARRLRRRAVRVEGAIEDRDGSIEPLDAAALLAPLERALRALSWSVVALAIALAIARLT